ncbi:hypothetical protein C8J57DRAFT_1496582 [Mycena rebaudengoi]|nr:hypothetical protein C8J57DRAFT_1496582 [Mycena rebaudengoi]
MNAQRSRRRPTLSHSVKSSLDPALHPNIDAFLKDLKTCARRLQPTLTTLSDELQILHRLYYKGNNQHRSSLFWRRVSEMKKYGDRLEELSLSALVDSLRYSFFGEEQQQTSKLLKGPLDTFSRCDLRCLCFGATWSLPDIGPKGNQLPHIHAQLLTRYIHQMHDRLAQAYWTFTLAMQSGAFIQLILTLAAIASRMSSLVADLIDALELTWSAAHRILAVLDPARSQKQKHPQKYLQRRQRASAELKDGVTEPTTLTLSDVYEDFGVSIARQRSILPENSVVEDAGVSIARQHSQEADQRATPPVVKDSSVPPLGASSLTIFFCYN